MTTLNPARREELKKELGDPLAAAGLAPLIATWLAEAKAEGATEVRARVEAALARGVFTYPHPEALVPINAVRAALVDPEAVA